MKKTFVCLLLILATLPASAQGGRDRFAWEYGADFLFHFDNREFAYSQDAITPSMTVAAVVLTPTVGFSVRQSRAVEHRLTAGVELAHDLGSQTWNDLPREVLIYYDAHIRARKGSFEGVAGIFPRRFLEGEYSEAFFSDSLRFADRNLEGVLLKWQSPRFNAELGCDWMGQAGYARKERFQVISYGSWQPHPLVYLGWTGSFYHYAGSVLAPGVVDNHLLEPWVKVGFLRPSTRQELTLKAGLLAGYQCDRVRSSEPVLPLGGEVTLKGRYKSLSLQNSVYFGNDLQPFYDRLDLGGNKYGHDLYFGQPFYTGFYDRVEFSWMPALTRYLDLRLAVRAHFSADGFLGWQQCLGLLFNFDALRQREFYAGRCL